MKHRKIYILWYLSDDRRIGRWRSVPILVIYASANCLNKIKPFLSGLTYSLLNKERTASLLRVFWNLYAKFHFKFTRTLLWRKHVLCFTLMYVEPIKIMTAYLLAIKLLVTLRLLSVYMNKAENRNVPIVLWLGTCGTILWCQLRVYNVRKLSLQRADIKPQKDLVLSVT